MCGGRTGWWPVDAAVLSGPANRVEAGVQIEEPEVLGGVIRHALVAQQQAAANAAQHAHDPEQLRLQLVLQLQPHAGLQLLQGRAAHVLRQRAAANTPRAVTLTMCGSGDNLQAGAYENASAAELPHSRQWRPSG